MALRYNARMGTKKTPLSQFTDEEIFAEAARRMRARQTTPNPPVLRPCPKCDLHFGARAMRKHIPLCKGPIPAPDKKPSR